jgi:hypothetical protein
VSVGSTEPLDKTGEPVFVVGASRSGTNLVRALLNAHSEVWVSGETHYFDDLRPRLPGAGTVPLEGGSRDLCERYFLALSHRPFGQAGDPAASKVASGELRSLADELGGTGDAYFEALCRLRAVRHGKARWAEKTPRHVFRIDDMLGAFPGAKVVCIVRDPRAVVASYRDWHAAGKRKGAPESAEREADRKRSRRSYNLMLQCLLWRGVVQASYRALERHGGERVRVVRFEELAADPERSVPVLCEWLGLPWEPSMLDIPVVNSSYATSGQGVSAEPVDRWRGLLSADEIAAVQSCCGRLMDELRYAREDVPVSPVRVAAAWASVPVGVARAAAFNRDRLGRVVPYVKLRASAAFSRRGVPAA